ncbi:lipopolysaccharide assembly protein LapB [Porphyromonas sp. COT-239 OH1446]|uniref:tetratricopeptide repeat protein n=1 Tax=Porphyromonas sp. COT-239 OH1446 TaxID=1515613 RepID=UPI00052C81A9|nr:tetratricopeptide repeat protein [Porphyromonas sp. COT-239 OH1446]KGN68425.1 tetratricopeptide repeat protein [Porphyromonas sp. COT-239 OH1446]
MKLKKFILGAALTFVATSAYAQTGAATGTPFGSGKDSIDCRQNLSLFGGFVRSGSMQEAIAPWEKAYRDCPASSKNIYIHGSRILKWRIGQEKDATKRMELINRLLKLHDDRAKYFGNDPRHGVDVIMSSKITDYITLMQADVDYNQILSWTRPVIEASKHEASPQLLYFHANASRAIALKDKSQEEAYVKEYMLMSDYLDKQVAAAAEDSTTVNKILTVKTQMDTEFVQSGFANCELINKIYTVEKVEENKDNKDFLSFACSLFQFAGCESPAYSKASRYLFAFEPSARAAVGIASDALSSGRYEEATEYLLKAIEHSQEATDRAKCYEGLAQIALKQNKFSDARSYSNKALAENPRSGPSLILLAQMIGNDADRIFPDDKVKQRCVYYLVIDKLQQAASLDPSVASRANSLIANYRRSLPSPSDIFMHPDLKAGQSFTVPGYGTTTIR